MCSPLTSEVSRGLREFPSPFLADKGPVRKCALCVSVGTHEWALNALVGSTSQDSKLNTALQLSQVSVL